MTGTGHGTGQPAGTSTTTTLPGQETLLASWAALARTSPGAGLVHSPGAVAAVFPDWAPLNNAILLDDVTTASTVAARLGRLYAAAGVGTWALWIPSRATDLDTSDEPRTVDGPCTVDGLTRDTTTLVMRAVLQPGPTRTDGVVRTSIDAAIRAADEPLDTAELGSPEAVPGLAAWALLRDGAAVAGAWSFRHGADCGIYTVGTAPAWRRRGLATALLRHVLAVAEQDGARTATLQSTPMARGLYAALGFLPVGRYEEWVHTIGIPTTAGTHRDQ
jgi:GNAT superfamily N-acetyltransferase